MHIYYLLSARDVFCERVWHLQGSREGASRQCRLSHDTVAEL